MISKQNRKSNDQQRLNVFLYTRMNCNCFHVIFYTIITVGIEKTVTKNPIFL